MNTLNRRIFLGNASLLTASAFSSHASGFQNDNRAYTVDEIKKLLPGHVPANFIAFISKILNHPYRSVGIKEGDNAVIEALVKCSRQGLTPGLEFAVNWFNKSAKNPTQDGAHPYPYRALEGRDRSMDNAVIPFNLYCGTFGLSFSCYELYTTTRDERARRQCLTVADTILHYAARDGDGLVGHDDSHMYEWAIPDVVYFVAVPLMIASVLDERNRHFYVEQALYQTHSYFNLFYDPETGIVKTIRFTDSGLGKTYWCRALGWLIFTIGGVLRYLDPGHPDFETIRSYLVKLADGAVQYQGPHGGLRAFVNDMNAPEEITGTAMCARIINEGIRNGWLAKEYTVFVDRATDFILNSIDGEGNTRNAYIRWAIPAEGGELVMGNFFEKSLGYSGFLLQCLHELLFHKA